MPDPELCGQSSQGHRSERIFVRHLDALGRVGGALAEPVWNF